MSKLNDGGPAFPNPALADPNFTDSDGREHGMTLRDWFAGQALAGMMALPSDTYPGNFHNNWGEPFFGPAEYAYRMADAMLAARSKGEV